MREPNVNIGQSEFQDKFMVIANELTPYHKLRKLKLQIKKLEDAIIHNQFNVRKTEVKIKRLKQRLSTSRDELDEIKIEELEYNLKGYIQLKDDDEHRLANFNEIKRQVLEETPEEYWDQGFENAEAEYWVEYFSCRAALEIVGTGAISTRTLGQIVRFPDSIVNEIMKKTPHKQLTITKQVQIAHSEAENLSRRAKHRMIRRELDK